MNSYRNRFSINEVYLCMRSASSRNSLFVANFITGISDGLVLPFVAGIVAYPFFENDTAGLTGISITVALIGGLAYGAARFFGEREEIKHNHPQLALHEVEKETELMNTIGIDTELTNDMQSQMEQERKMWLSEVEENEMGWELYDERRALKSGAQTGIGFFTGGLAVCLPFCFSNSDIRSLVFPCAFYLALLFLFGWTKGKILHTSALRSSLQLVSRGFILLVFALAVVAFISMADDKQR